MINPLRNIRQEEVEQLQLILKKKRLKTKTRNLEKLRCAIYARKSQEDSKDSSLSTQIEYCKSLINGCTVLELSLIFQEDNKSGMWDDRTEFQSMIKSINNNEIDVVVVYRWDRFSRKLSDTQRYYEMIVQAGGTVLAGDSVIMVDSAQSLYFQQLFWSNNEYQARVSAERTIDTLISRTKNDHIVSGGLPLGYKRESSNNKSMVVIDEIESAIIYQIFEKISTGMSITSVSNILNQSGLRTRSGSRFTKQSVEYIARNPIYKGTLIYNKFGNKKRKKRLLQRDYEEVVIENAIVPIVSKELFDKVQCTLDGKSSARYLDIGYVYLLSGLIKCKSCGHTMVGASQVGRKKQD